MLSPGDRIGDWIVESPLGQGAIGAVWRCHHTVTQKLRAAVKVYQLGEIPEGERWFLTEVETLSRLRHPSIVGIRSPAVDAQRQLGLIAMELVDGETLGARLARGPLDLDSFRRTFVAVADALACAHEHHIFHRDIKPANIMLRPDETPVIVDFGVAADLEAGPEVTGVGTPPYLPPEWFRSGGSADPARMDVYALGVVMTEALLARRAFPGVRGGDDTRFAHYEREKAVATALDPGPSFPAALRALLREATDPDGSQLTMRNVADRLRDMDLRPPAAREWRIWIAGGVIAALLLSALAGSLTWWWVSGLR